MRQPRGVAGGIDWEGMLYLDLWRNYDVIRRKKAPKSGNFYDLLPQQKDEDYNDPAEEEEHGNESDGEDGRMRNCLHRR